MNTIAGGFSYGGQSSQSQKCHLHAIQDIDINFVDTPLQWSLPPITFTERDFKGINSINQEGHVVVSIIIAILWCPRSLSTRTVPLISCPRKPSKNLRSHPTLSTLTLVYSSALQARESRLEATWTWWPPSIRARSLGASPSDICRLT